MVSSQRLRRGVFSSAYCGIPHNLTDAAINFSNLQIWQIYGIIHRKNNPAVISSGSKKVETWYYFGNIHRENDAAVISYSHVGNVITKKMVQEQWIT
jgi:hypothetical protein